MAAPLPTPQPGLDKRLGQHHLVAGALCRPLVEFLAPRGERVIEIGPGGGVLTAELLAAGAARVAAWEVDLAWAAELRRRLPDPRLAIVAGDALDLDWRRVAGGGRPWLAAGNLPYNVSTVLVERLLTGAAGAIGEGGGRPRAAFLVQKEVADRLTAGAGDAVYGALSVLVAAHAEARVLGRLRPGSFRPPPKVDSAFVGLTLRPPPLPPAEMPAFLSTVRAAFAQRRKTLRNSLGAAWGRPTAESALAAAGLDPGARAQELALSAFLALHRARGRDRA